MNTLYRREFDLLIRLYLLINGFYSSLDCAISPDIMDRLDITLSPNFVDNDISSLTTVQILACQSNARVTAVFKRVLLVLLAEDSSVRINGKLLGELKKYFLTRDFNYLFEALPSGVVDIVPLIKQYGLTNLFNHLKWYYFRELSPTMVKRFELHIEVPEIIKQLDTLNIKEHVEQAVNYVLPNIVKTAQGLRKQFEHDS